MKKNEFLRRYFYADKLCEGKFDNKSPEEISKITNCKKEQSLKEAIFNIDKECKGLLYNRLIGKYCKIVELELNRLCFCKIHAAQFGRSHGDLLLDFLKNPVPDDIKRVEKLNSIIEVYIKEMPSIVHKNGEKYEVWLGNHRLINLIKNGKKTCKVLATCDKKESQHFPDMIFNL